MPASDILNPTPSHLLNPDYGWQRKRPVTHIATKANQGIPYFREMTDVGHQFLLNWGITGSERERSTTSINSSGITSSIATASSRSSTMKAMGATTWAASLLR